MFKKFFHEGPKTYLNMRLPNGYVIHDVATKVGAVLDGEKGKKVGEKIDSLTKNITINLFNKK